MEKSCLIKGCLEDSAKVAFVNYAGNVLVLPVCQAHFDKYHKKCNEDIELDDN
jgi:hypothetical protein